MNESGFKLYLICISVAATPAPAAVAFLLESSKPFIGTKNNYICIYIHTDTRTLQSVQLLLHCFV